LGHKAKIIKTHKCAAGGYPRTMLRISPTDTPPASISAGQGWPLFSTAATRQIEKACAERLPPHG
jgi:hypothetical protein